MRLTHCPEFQYKCPMSWDDLKPTADASIRFCTKCHEKVYECHGRDEFLEHVKQNHCVTLVHEPTKGGPIRTMGIAIRMPSPGSDKDRKR
jgi:hypothetical protein